MYYEVIMVSGLLALLFLCMMSSMRSYRQGITDGVNHTIDSLERAGYIILDDEGNIKKVKENESI